MVELKRFSADHTPAEDGIRIPGVRTVLLAGAANKQAAWVRP